MFSRGGVLLLVGALAMTSGCRGKHQGPGAIEGSRLPEPVVVARATRQTGAHKRLVADAVSETGAPKQVLFGDLHVHTTFSTDAFMRALPMLQGEGTHPPADACDFARYCSGLDFWSINDHAEAVSPQHWQETKESIRQCNAVAGDPENPDIVAFLGWEWTQTGFTPADHFGHKNVILRETAEDKVPKRPISALAGPIAGVMRRATPFGQRLLIPLYDFPNRQTYFDFGLYQKELREVPLCPEGVHTRELPEDCHEKADTPQELYEKLSQWGFDTIVIPHGTTWGLYTPQAYRLDNELTAAQYEPQKQTLFEIYSGHGNSEEYPDWRSIAYDADGAAVCPQPSQDYLPCCWQAGELIRARCGELPDEECKRRVTEARRNYLEAGPLGDATVPWASMEDWKDCSQCRDCFNPAFKYRPGGAGQYALAITNFDDPAQPRRFRFGFIASSDNHSARPGTGYKEYRRRMMSEASGARDATWHRRLFGPDIEPKPESVRIDLGSTSFGSSQMIRAFERQASFFMTGGLVAAHAEGRDRNAIWQALKRREVYGTSGDRILLWFDLLIGSLGDFPMGSEVALNATPVFRVRAVGSFKQKPGCPQHSVNGLSSQRLERLCRGQCYNPSDERRLITRVEIVRIRPQQRADEPVGTLIEDPWRRFDCSPNPVGCEIVFDDPEFLTAGRETIYYARVIQEPTLAVNAGGLRCRYNEQGDCEEMDPCYGDYRTPLDDDCLSPNEERAWSSPIYVKVATGK